MSLRDRIKAASTEAVRPNPASTATPNEAPMLEAEPVAGTPSEKLKRDAPIEPPKPKSGLPATTRSAIHRQIIRDLGPKLFDDSISGGELEDALSEAITSAFTSHRIPLVGSLFEQFASDIRNDVIGFGPLEEFLADDTVTEIMVNGPEIVFVERLGKTVEVPSGFVDGDHVRRVIDKIVSQIGRRIDESSPMVDARLPDGSRVNAVIQPLAIGGPFLTIRKFAKDPFQIEDLIRFNSLDERSALFLKSCIEGKLNVVVSGGTGTGKTTLLNVLSSFIPSDERIVTVEDAKELQLHQRHVLCLETRPANVEGKGEITIRDLVKNSLRMRPDRIVVGECRGGEALDMLQAMNTGHDGSMTTIHANTPRDAMSRIETLTLMAGYDLPIRAIRDQAASAIDLVVQLTRMRDGTRRVTHITEVEGMEVDVITLQDIFLFDFAAGTDENGRHRGTLKPTGIQPAFAEQIRDNGIELDSSIFGIDADSLKDRIGALR